jgi:hypothetical protein
MAYDTPSMFIKPPTAGQRRDLPRYAIPEDAAYRLENMVRRGGKVTTIPLYNSNDSADHAIRGIFAYPHSDGSDRLVAATDRQLWRYSAGAWAALTGTWTTTTYTDFPIFRVFTKSGTSYLVVVNGTGATPKKWDGSAGSVSDVGGSPGGARAIAILANRMVLGNFASAPTQIKVSDFNDFESGWASVQIANLSDTPGHIMSMNETGALVANVYKTDAWYVITAASGLYPFQLALRKVVPGPMSPACVVSTPAAQYILARDFNIYQCDGSVYTPLGDHIRYEVADTINVDKMTQSWGFYNPNKNEIWFLWCGAGKSVTTRGLILKMDGTVWPVAFDWGTEGTDWRPTAGCEFLFDTGTTIGAMTSNIGSYTNALGSYAARNLYQLLGTNNGTIMQESMNPTNCGAQYNYQSGMVSPSPDRKFVTVNQLETYLAPVSEPNFTGYVTLEYSSIEGGDTAQDDTVQITPTASGPFTTGARRDARFFGLKIWGNVDYDAMQSIEYEGTRISGVERGRR